MRFLLLILLFFAGMQVKTNAAAVPVPVKVVTSDSSKVTLRNFNAQKLEAYRTDKDFIYDDAPPLTESWWDRFWRWFWEQINGVLANKTSGTLIKYLVMAVLGALVVFLVIKFIGADLKIFAKKAKEVSIPYHEYEDNIHEINFDEQIEKAVALSNYRLAVRLLYLQSLKKLSDRNLIHWLPEKTNQMYINEFKDADKQQQFTLLTHQFEYIWYGEFFIGNDAFRPIKETFDHFNRSIA